MSCVSSVPRTGSPVHYITLHYSTVQYITVQEVRVSCPRINFSVMGGGCVNTPKCNAANDQIVKSVICLESLDIIRQPGLESEIFLHS